MSNQIEQPPKDAGDPTYLSFFLRLWRAGDTASPNWRASLENLESGKRLGFTNLEQLFGYLMDLIEGSAKKDGNAHR